MWAIGFNAKGTVCSFQFRLVNYILKAFWFECDLDDLFIIDEDDLPKGNFGLSFF
jgi:hypothetical protein